jgi:C-terminal processing protease CtpA/Prc
MTDTIQLTVASSEGVLNEQQVVAKERPDSVPAYLADQPHHIIQSSRDVTLYRLTRQPDVAVLQLRSVGGMLNQFRLRRMFRLLRKQPVRQLVLDLRNNTGGRIWTAVTLLKQLLPQSATVTFERYRKPKVPGSFGVSNRLFRPLYNARLAIRTSVSRTAERVRYTYTIRSAPNLFDGQLTVLTNGGTASAASLIAAYLREQNRAVFIGEETGGSRFVSAGMLVPTLRLRYSHVRVRVPLFQVIHNSKTANDGHGVQPDVPVYEWTSTKDVVMQKALEQ